MAKLRGDASGRRLSDLDLMRAVQSGSPDAFEVLIVRHLPAAQRLARAICHDDERAEDAVQEALLSAWRRRATYRAQAGAPASWLLSIVHNRAIDARRSERRHRSRRAPHDDLARVRARDDVCAEVDSTMRLERIGASLAALPAAQRDALGLAVYAQLSHREIALKLDVPLGTAKARVRRGLRDVRRALAFSPDVGGESATNGRPA